MQAPFFNYTNMDIQKELLSYAKEVYHILKLNRSERAIENDAVLLLKLNRNRILYENIVRRKNWDKLEYELKKQLVHLCDRVGIKPEELEPENKKELEPTGDITPEMEEKAGKVMLGLEAMESSGNATLGLRADHDSLPEEIKILPEKNREIYPIMRKTHEQLKLMEGAKPCDRYPFVKELIRLDDALQANWIKYDTYSPGAEQSKDEKKEPSATMDAKQVSAARKYLSTNKSKLAKLLEEKEDPKAQEKAAELRNSMVERIKELTSSGESIAEKQLTELMELGVSLG